LLEADGIPEGCLVSVRAGSIRRQAPVEANKPCKLLFPDGVSKANPFKVDLLAPLGSTYFEVSTAKEKYPFEVKSRYGGKSMHVTLRVRQETKGAANAANELDGMYNVPQSINDNVAASVAHESPARRHHAAMQQRSYLDSHELMPWMNSLMQDLLKDRPDDPWSYIDASTAHARMKSKGYSPTAVPSAAQLDLGSSKAGSAILPSAKSAQTSLRQQARQRLLTAGGNGSLEAFCRSRQEDLRTRTVEALEAAVASGRLAAAAQESSSAPSVVASPTDLAYSPGTTTASTPSMQPSARLASLPSDSSRVNPGETLPQPAAAALPRTEQSPVARNEMDELRRMARESMLKASEDGGLMIALTSLAEEEAAERYASRDQCLEGISKEKSEDAAQDEIEKLRQQAKATLLEARTSGKLATLTTVKQAHRDSAQEKSEDAAQDEIEKLRQQAKATLMEARSSGKLATLTTVKQAHRDCAQEKIEDAPQDEIEKLRQQAKATLLEARTSGKLATLQTAPQRKKNKEELLFEKIDYKKDGIIDRDELEYAIERGIIKRPAGFVTTKEVAAAKTMVFQKKASVGTWCQPRLACQRQMREMARQVKESSAPGTNKEQLGKKVASSPVNVARPVDSQQAKAMSQRLGAPTAAQPVSASEALVTDLHSRSPQLPPQSAGLRSRSQEARARLAQLEGDLAAVQNDVKNGVAEAPAMRPLMPSKSESSISRKGSKSQAYLLPIQASNDVASEDPRIRQERFKLENDALRRENARLKKMREAGDAANVLCTQNDQLRKELGRLMTFNSYKMDQGGNVMRMGDSMGRGY